MRITREHLAYPMLCFVLGLTLASLPSCSDNETGHIYSTWDTMEADKFASAWLIKRFVDKDAEFEFYPVGQPIPEGIPFDTPDAEIRRYHNMATFEFVLQKYGIEDEYLRTMADTMHELEIISWQRELTPEAKQVDRSIKAIVQSSESPEACLAECMRYFDGYYNDLKQPHQD